MAKTIPMICNNPKATPTIIAMFICADKRSKNLSKQPLSLYEVKGKAVEVQVGSTASNATASGLR